MRVLRMMALASALFVVMGTLAFAKVASRYVTFGLPVVVNGTSLQAGTYKLSFDDQSNELTISDAKTKQVVAKSKCRVEKRQKPGGGLDIQLSDQAGAKVLTAVGFPDDKRSIQLVNGSDTASN